MSPENHIIKTAPFPELLAVPTALAKNELFDIIIDEKITQQNYCAALLNKVLELSKSKYNPFIDYNANKQKML